MADLINIINFDLGPVRATPAVIHAWKSRELDPRKEGYKLIARHWMGDWGDMDDHDKGMNDEALVAGSRIMSRYEPEPGWIIYIITEADRSLTTIRLASEHAE